MYVSLKPTINSDKKFSGFGKITASKFHQFSLLQICKTFCKIEFP